MLIVLLTIGVSMKYVISTQMLENYGAHSENGKFKDGNAHWKFKGGTDYIVSGFDRPANAVAFVHAFLSKFYEGSYSMCWKEYPTTVQTYDEWFADLPAGDELDVQTAEHRQFILENARHVDVNDDTYPYPFATSGPNYEERWSPKTLRK
tara:strand:+ start:1280 stop:1729 length:450 start_codon:yes stop_codon:yes gene_type:complete